MEAFNELVMMMERRMRTSHEEEMASKELEIKRLAAELEATKVEGRKQAGRVMGLKDEWKRAFHKRSIFEA